MGRFDRLAAPVWKSQEQVREDIASIVNEINQKKIKDAVEAVYKIKKARFIFGENVCIKGASRESVHF